MELVKPEVAKSELQAWLRDEVGPALRAIIDDPPEYFPTDRVTQEEAAKLVLTADWVINADPSDLIFADGSGGKGIGDGGFDIVHIHEGEATTRFDVYQNEGPKLDKVEQGQFGRPVSKKFESDLNEIYKTVFGDRAPGTLNPDARDALLQIRQAIESSVADHDAPAVEIVIHPVSFKTATDEAVAEYVARGTEIAKLISEEHPRVQLVAAPPLLPEHLWEKSFRRSPKTAPAEIRVRIIGKIADSGDGYPKLAFAFVKDLVGSFHEYGPALLDSNLRHYRGKTDVNEKIIEELKSTKGLKTFHVKNNGLVVTATGITSRGDRLVLKKPQIINGGQTIRCIYDSWRSKAEEKPNGESRAWLEAFDHMLVSVRVVPARDPQQTDQIAIASNTQNKLTARTLRSSDPTLKALARTMAGVEYPWFLEIKDGEWDAIKDDRGLMQSKTGKIKRHFQFEANRRKIRRLDNKQLGIALAAFCGFPAEAKETRIFLNPHFRLIFHSSVADGKWGKLTRELAWASEAHKQATMARRPGPHQCLLASFVLSYWKDMTKTEAQAVQYAYDVKGARDESFRKQFFRNKKWNVPEKETTELKTQTPYWAERALKSIYKVLCYESMKLLLEKYGDLDDDMCARILRASQLHQMFEGQRPLDLGDFRDQTVDSGLLTTMGRIFLVAARRFVNGDHEEAFKKLLSPQQSMLKLDWRVRIGDAVGDVLSKLSDSGFREANDLEPQSNKAISSWADLFPDT